MSYNIGIKQGIISNCIDKFPYKYWKYEFDIAKLMNFDSLEWVIDSDPISSAYSPLLSENRAQEIEEIVDTTGIKISSVYAQAFEEYSLIRFDNPGVLQRRIDQLEYFIKCCAGNHIKNITIPFNSYKIKTDVDISNIVFALKVSAKIYEQYNVNINISTNLEPKYVNEIISKSESKLVGIDYTLKNRKLNDLENIISEYGVNINIIHIGCDFEIKNIKDTFAMFNSVCFDGPIIINKANNKQQLANFISKLKKELK